MLARWRSLRFLSVPAGPEGGPVTGEGPVGVPVGALLDLGPEGGPVGDVTLREPLLGVFVWIGGGMLLPNLAMREGCMPATGPLSVAGVEGCELGVWRSPY